MSDLSYNDITAANAEQEWFAFRVRPRHEKSSALQLCQKHQECFLPLIREKRKWGNRPTSVDVPLFPGYIFCRSHRFGLLPILQTYGVIDVLRAGKSPLPVAEGEIRALKQAVAASVKIERCPYLDTGKKVEIHEGPLAGLTGIVVEIRNSKRLVLSVILLRRSVLVELEPDAVGQVNKPPQLSAFDYAARPCDAPCFRERLSVPEEGWRGIYN